jgi:dTDP-4-dehydrorhamnose reductase
MRQEKPRLLVVGARGFLGSIATLSAVPEFEVIEGNRTTTGRPAEVEIDITNESTVKTAFATARPDSVLLLSAISDIDRCEQFPEDAKAVNFHGAEHVANACARSKAQLLFVSTAAVFDGRKYGYTEETPVSPISIYGETKAMAESSVEALVPSAIIVRIALVLGFAGRPGTNAFLDSLRAQWISGQTVALPIFEQRNPIDAVTASRFMLDLLKKPGTRGIFHIGCKDSITRYHLGLKVAFQMGYPGQVQPQREPVPGRAPRGPDHFLLTDKLAMTSSIAIPTCDQVIERCFDGLA